MAFFLHWRCELRVFNQVLLLSENLHAKGRLSVRISRKPPALRVVVDSGDLMKTLISFIVKLALIASCYLLIGFSWTAQAAMVIPPGEAHDPVQTTDSMRPVRSSLSGPQNGTLVGLTPTLSIDFFANRTVTEMSASTIKSAPALVST